ncbi:MAG: class I SAM-dependent methyltransferase, partial [Planctomycetota bacterium]
MVLRARLDAALARRASPDLLTALDTDAIRLVDSAGDDLPRLTIERYRDAVRIGGGPEWAPALDTLRAPFLDTPVFWRLGHDCEGGPDGDAGDRVVREGDRRHPVSLAGRRNPGLFLDARPARAWAAAHSDGRRVLNLFAFTCAFGVAAARGGARSTVNVDTAAGALERGRR